MGKSIAIIGAGMAGLAAGIYGQRSGFETRIFEAHSVPGGQCTAWKRNGYVFDGCIHYLGGSGGTKSPYDRFWTEVGAFPCEMIPTSESIAAVFPDGAAFHDYFDPKRLEESMKALSPEDAKRIDKYLAGIRLFTRKNPILDLSFGSFGRKLAAIPPLLRRLYYFATTLERFAEGFSDPRLRAAFPHLHYSAPGVPLFMQLSKHADAAGGSSAWPKGGSRTIASNMASRYLGLGGAIECGKKVVRILTEDGRATGVELADGARRMADYVVSDADGRKTLFELLGGDFAGKAAPSEFRPRNDAEVPWAVSVYLGVRRDLSAYPASLLYFLEEPQTLCGCLHDHLDVQVYGFDPTMAPPGKGVIKVEIPSPPSYFSRLHGNRAGYREEKEKVARRVIELLDRGFPGIASDVEVIDVTTLKTWERYMGGTDGFNNFPNKPFSILGMLSNADRKYMLPGLKNFYFVGQWVTSAGALYLNAVSGRTVIEKIRRDCGKKLARGERAPT